MTTRTSAVEARRNLGRLLNIVSLTDEDVVIERAGKPIARLSGCQAVTRSGSGKNDLRKAKGLGRELWKRVDADAYLEEERGAWD